jgi:diphosphomevalonate decarboxylase
MNATAVAHPNIALIKYWGDQDPELHIPSNGSISMNLQSLITQTRVNFNQDLQQDQFILDGRIVDGLGFERVNRFLARVRKLAGIKTFARVESQNNFPNGAGIASSASGFAALSMAASKAACLALDEKDLTRLARTGSGSACRSIPPGFVEWVAGTSDDDSYAYSIAPPDHWNLADCILIVSQDEKLISSSHGHLLAQTSFLQTSRVADAPRRLDVCRNAILSRDFDALAQVTELDSNLMHAVMITSTPSIIYWRPETVRIMKVIQSLRETGLPVCYTIDAGPNVHVICPGEMINEISSKLENIAGVIKVLKSSIGGGAVYENNEN